MTVTTIMIAEAVLIVMVVVKILVQDNARVDASRAAKEHVRKNAVLVAFLDANHPAKESVPMFVRVAVRQLA